MRSYLAAFIKSSKVICINPITSLSSLFFLEFVSVVAENTCKNLLKQLKLVRTYNRISVYAQ